MAYSQYNAYRLCHPVCMLYLSMTIDVMMTQHTTYYYH